MLFRSYFYANGDPFTITAVGSALILSSNAVGDGTSGNFTLPTTSTSAATIVAINGVVQEPSYAYTVSGTTLTFTVPPALNDKIDISQFNPYK